MGTDAEQITNLCEQHADLPRRVALTVGARLPIDPDELMPAAWEGLYRAAATWRPDGGATFPDWAWRKIRGAIVDGLRDEHPVPREHWRHSRQVWAARGRVTAELRRAPTDDEVQAASGLTPAEWARYQRWARVAGDPLSIEAHPHEWPAGTPDPPDGLDRWVRAAAACLPEQEAQVIAALYWDRATVADVARDLGVVESRVSQIRWAAIARIRDATRSTRDPPAGTYPTSRSTRRTPDDSPVVNSTTPTVSGPFTAT